MARPCMDPIQYDETLHKIIYLVRHHTVFCDPVQSNVDFMPSHNLPSLSIDFSVYSPNSTKVWTNLNNGAETFLNADRVRHLTLVRVTCRTRGWGGGVYL